MSVKLSAVLACGAILSLNAFADDWNKKTVLTIDQPILVPGTTLQPGKYVVKLLDSPSNRHIVRFLNEREDQVITTVLAIPNSRLQPTGKTEFLFWETPAGNPPALRAWFFPGDNFGQEFAYPKGLAAKIAAQASAPVPTVTEQRESELAKAPVTITEKPAAPVPQQRAQVVKPVVPEPAAAPTQAPAPLPEQMPQTGSFGPAILLAGLASTAAGLLLRKRIHAR
jgi:LPXTG-motif cell wall-anchored protein